VLEAIHSFEKVSGIKLNYVTGPRRPGDIMAIYANNSLAKEKLNWNPKYSLDEIPGYMHHMLGEELLTPTRIYVKPIIEILNRRKSIRIHGLAHITGGSFTKLARLNKRVRFMLNNLPSVEGIFKQIQVEGRVDINEMYRTFNMGIGFCVILPRNSVDKVF